MLIQSLLLITAIAAAPEVKPELVVQCQRSGDPCQAQNWELWIGAQDLANHYAIKGESLLFQGNRDEFEAYSSAESSN